MFKGLRVTKIVKRFKCERVWGELEANNFSEKILDKIFEAYLRFHVKYTALQEVSFLYFSILLALTAFSLWEEKF